MLMPFCLYCMVPLDCLIEEWYLVPRKFLSMYHKIEDLKQNASGSGGASRSKLWSFLVIAFSLHSLWSLLFFVV